MSLTPESMSVSSSPRSMAPVETTTGTTTDGTDSGVDVCISIPPISMVPIETTTGTTTDGPHSGVDECFKSS